MSNTNKNTRHAGNFGEEQHDGRNKVSVSPFVDALTEDYNRLQNETRALVVEGREWVARHPVAWSLFEGHMSYCVAHGKRIEWRNLCAAAKAKDNMAAGEDIYLSIDNNLGPLFMRWLVMLHPEAKSLCKFKHCRFDDVSIGGPYHA